MLFTLKFQLYDIVGAKTMQTVKRLVAPGVEGREIGGDSCCHKHSICKAQENGIFLYTYYSGPYPDTGNTIASKDEV